MERAQARIGKASAMATVLPKGVTWRDVAIVAGATVIGALLLVVGATVMGPKYSSTALVNGGPGSTASLPLDLSTDVTQRYVATELIYIDTLGPEMAAAMTAATGVQDPAPIQSNQDGDTNVILMTAIGADPEQAAALATAAADVYITNWRERTRADPDRAELASVKSDRYVQRPTALDAKPTTSRTALGLLGAILGFAIGVLIVYLRVRRRDSAPADA